MAGIFSSLDGVREKSGKTDPHITRLLRPSEWFDGLGGIYIPPEPWDSLKADYAFIDEIEELRPLVRGKGNLERFDYWLNQFKYLEATGRFACTLDAYNNAVGTMDAMGNIEQKSYAVETLLPLLRKEIEELKKVHEHLIASVSTRGGIGNITNWQQHIIPLYIAPQIKQIKELTRDSSWVNSLWPSDLPKIRRIVVPPPQTILEEGSDYRLKVICFNVTPAKAMIYWRILGQNKYP